ncbi:MAG: SusC/RagA family TonB-linked outer membrane protein [Pseudopedobacter saltans]|uniref:SusC/RagA family TonB-linked outer membrane protein n=1 Tax=Pseudopedobacter saltans TaxID=151895 RepID=A0A2W5H3T7_9SPHI|nr:MAG: SusC/RagA family TonB-linked outer membrane protein [Pseudopedobacter saltans]
MRYRKLSLRIVLGSMGFFLFSQSSSAQAIDSAKISKKEKDSISNANALDEVVVTALGRTQSRAKVGYSTATFNTNQINKNSPIGVLDGIAGKVAGADISNIGGATSSTKVVLRGYGAISGGDNQPLYVIDGVPFQGNSSAGNASGSADYGSGISSVNPADIESVTILKGTAATALYGSQAKNGAIMITTKSGKAGKLKVEYFGTYDFSKVGKLPDMQDQFGQGWGGEFVLPENGSWGPRLDGKMRPWGSIVDNSQLVKPFSFVKNNIRDFYQTGKEFNNNVSVSGGNEHNQIYFSYGNLYNDGPIPTKVDYLQRNTFSLRTNTEYGNFKAGFSFNYTNRKVNIPSTGQSDNGNGGVFQSLLQIPVDIPIKDFAAYNNKFFNVDNYFTPYAANPYYGLNENGNTQNSDRFFGSIDLSYAFTKHFSVQWRTGGDFFNARTFEWAQPNKPSTGSWNDGGNTEGAVRAPAYGGVYQGSSYLGTINSDLILKYNQDITPDFNLDVIAGGNYYQLTQRTESASVTSLTIPGFFNLSNSTQQPTAVDFNSRNRRKGLYGQVTLGYKEQLFLTGNVRNDWSSTLPQGSNSFFYPGASLSWLASRTFDLSNTPISYLKLRAAYGKTGSDPSAYQTAQTLVASNVNLGYGALTSPFNGVSAFGISNQLANANLTPIFTKEFETGFEAKFLHDRIGLDATYYDKRTKGQVFAVPIDPATGYTTLVQNLGTVRNRGIELTLNATPIRTKDFSWNTTYTYTKNWNKVLELTGGTPNPLLASSYDAELRAVVGKSVASVYAPIPQLSPDGKVVVNAAGLPQVNTTPDSSNYGMTKGYYGQALYDYMMGWTNTFSYKNVSLSFSLDFRYGGVMYSQTADMVLFDGNSKATLYNDRKPFVVPNSVVQNSDGSYSENTTVIGTSDYYKYFYPTTNPGSAYSQRIFDRSFLKLRDINLAYNLPSTVSDALKLSNLSVAVFAKNILLWTPKSNIFVDPEATNLGNDLTGQLGEFANAPLFKQFGVTLRASF